MKKKNIIKKMIATMMMLTMLMATSTVSFAQEIYAVKENEIAVASYTLGEAITRMEGTASGTAIQSQGFYITEPVTVSLILLGRPKDGNGFVRFRLYSLESNQYLVIKDFYDGDSAAAIHVRLPEGRYQLQVGSSTGGEYIYTGTVMVYQL